ncbi:uncharacterized protein LOC111716237 [Eurytemora carolleeae]|uniref:uncharacterized protein LOC111716237 n=1 Tax=Eurytemora carolleeae TaxID=1294199 RepID=UPI000C7728DE|nr:uncharacterized protein LOC111716237 [Eurytemora carolleeae]|eukprot:XP_023347442.1 uncharacterized protein LOC111716237 [Eurytemora affinis]
MKVENKMEAGALVRVLKDFLTTNDGELCVTKGEYLQVTHVLDKFWVECNIDLRSGYVPAANIAPVNLPRLENGEGICISRYLYYNCLDCKMEKVFVSLDISIIIV